MPVMSLIEAQLVVLILLFVGTFFCGSLPALIFRFSPQSCTSGRHNRLLSFFIYFGGGILFSTSLLHLLPEGHQEFLQYSQTASNISIGSDSTGKEHHHHTDTDKIEHHHSFQIPEFIVLCGFFATYLIEVLLGLLLERRSPNQHSNHGIRTKFCSCSQRNIECSRIYKPNIVATRLGQRKRSATWAGQITEQPSPQENPEQRGTPPDLLRSSIISRHFPKYGAVTAETEPGILPIRADGITFVNRPVAALPQLPQIPEIPNGNDTNSTTDFACVVTVAALSFHSVLEGLAIGFQKTSVGTWTLLLAIAIRKFVIAFVVGIEAVVGGSKVAMLLTIMFVFSIMSPAAMAVAMSLGTAERKMPNLLVCIVNCLAAGTLMYVVFFEVLRRKVKNGSCSHLRFMGMIVGATLMAALQYASSALLIY